MTIDGIWPPFEAFYIESMISHTKSATQSIDYIVGWTASIEKIDITATKLITEDLFFNLQNILHQSGCISRYFFPSRQGVNLLHGLRATKLRAAFQIKDDAALANRELRNATEHFDERLDIFLSRDHAGEFLPHFIGISPENPEIPRHILKGFYINTFEFILLNVVYQLKPIAQEILHIHSILAECTKNGHRLPPTSPGL
jgi:hypothetical protein